MTLPRRYSDDDVQRILALAAESEASALTAGDRPWTLEDVQRVGAEAGLSPASVAAAALAFERQGASPEDRRYLGLPIAVARAVPLDRELSDADWERLVSRLQDTFAARGRVEVRGGRREWRNGNLRVIHEPAGDGAVLELRTRKGDARAMFGMGAAMLVSSGITGAAVVAAGADPSGLAAAALAGAVSVATLVVGALRLPAWASVRARQFDAIAGFARRLTGAP